MFDLGSVVATLKADITNFKSGMEEAQGKLGGFKENVGGVLGVLGKVGVVAAAAIGVAAVGIKITSDAAGEAQKEMIKANVLLLQATKDNTKQFTEWQGAIKTTAAEMVKLGFDDEETTLAMTKSIAVTKNLKESQKEMALAADFARLKDIGIGEAQKVLQLAYMGNIRVLKQYGIEIDDKANKAEIFGKVQEIAGGQSAAFADSYAGSMARFGVEFTNLKEAIGAVFLPILTQAVTGISDFIAKLNTADFTWLTTALDGLTFKIGELLTWVTTTFFNIMTWLDANVKPYIMLFLQFFIDNWGQISLATQVMADILTSIFTIVTTVIMAIVTPFLAGLQQFWKDNGDNIIKGLQGTWNIIVGVFQVATGIVSAILAIFLGLLTGNWDQAWQKVKNACALAWEGIKNIFNGAVQFITGWGGTILNELVKPFQDAWNRISDFVNKIKDALDFTKRHSPSVVDIVQRGVKLVNNAMEDLSFGGVVTGQAAYAVSNQGPSTNINSITVDMSGAYIGDEFAANRLGEKVGDAIIKKLQLNVRF